VIARLAVLLVAGSCAETSGPRLESVTPLAARNGELVVIAGERLCGASGDCETAGGEVQFGLELPTLRARIVRYEDSEAEVEVPDLAAVGDTSIVVTVNESSSNELAFEVLP
jgi:hypothetical protein